MTMKGLLVALGLLMDDANVRDRAVQGKAAPSVTIEDAETRLVWLPFAGDSYSVRDPFTGYALLWSSQLALVVAAIWSAWFLLAPFAEEPWLRTKLGAPYGAYTRRVRRYL